MDLSKGIEFVPAFDGNRDKPEGERVKVRFHRLRYQFTSKHQKLAAEKDSEKQMELQNEIIRKHVSKIDNLYYGETAIKDGADLIDCEFAPVELVTEIANAIIGGKDEALEKN